MEFCVPELYTNFVTTYLQPIRSLLQTEVIKLFLIIINAPCYIIFTTYFIVIIMFYNILKRKVPSLCSKEHRKSLQALYQISNSFPSQDSGVVRKLVRRVKGLCSGEGSAGSGGDRPRTLEKFLKIEKIALEK